MWCMQWHMGISSPLDIVTLASATPAVTISKAIFAWIRSQVITGYRNVSNSNTSPYDSQRYILPNKTNIIGLDMNGMYAVTFGYQFSPGYRNVCIAVTCRYDF